MTEKEYKLKLGLLTKQFIDKSISFADFDKGRKEIKLAFESNPDNQPATVKKVLEIFGGEIVK